MELLQSVFAQWEVCLGAAAIIAVVINVGKSFGWLKDGQAQNASFVLNLLGLVALGALRVFKPEVSITELDAQAAQLANVLSVVVAYVVQLLGSKTTHLVLSGVPLFGKSFSK